MDRVRQRDALYESLYYDGLLGFTRGYRQDFIHQVWIDLGPSDELGENVTRIWWTDEEEDAEAFSFRIGIRSIHGLRISISTNYESLAREDVPVEDLPKRLMGTLSVFPLPDDLEKHFASPIPVVETERWKAEILMLHRRRSEIVEMIKHYLAHDPPRKFPSPFSRQ